MLRDKTILYIFVIAFCSGTGIAVIFAAIFLSIQITYEQSKLVALCAIIGQILSVVFSAKLGEIADSNHKERNLRLAYLTGIIFAVLSAYLSYINTQGVFYYISLLVTSSILTLVRMLDQVTRTSILHLSLSKDKYLEASKYLEIVRQGITFCSGGLAILLINRDNIYAASLFCALCLAVSYFLSHQFNTQLSTKEEVSQRSTIARFLEHFSSSQSFLLMIITLIPYSMVLTLNAVYPKTFIDITDNPQYYSALVIPYGIGAIIGGMFASRVAHVSLIRVSMLFMMLFSIALLGFSFVNNVTNAYILIFTFALCHSLIRVKRSHYLMLEVEKGMIGVVSGYYEMIALIFSILLSLASTAMVDAYGLASGVIGLTIVMLSGPVLIMFRYRGRSGIKSTTHKQTD
ncbi:hypothetical protein KCN56_09345 [Photobacterium galatheae]|uniref:hypothetical protein n=1 Tax=Photobacterium galatheae TaxID=1654360 RepID=UPI00202CF6EE|nr:hypothetical protein [Photobacterium galatheae]MCM0148764.1 hypothetical protein [Photobacterium galatheae]